MQKNLQFEISEVYTTGGFKDRGIIKSEFVAQLIFQNVNLRNTYECRTMINGNMQAIKNF